MRLKAIIHENDYHLATKSGEIIENVESCRVEGDLLIIAFKVAAIYGSPESLVEADAIAPNALPVPSQVIDYDYDPDEGPFFYNDAFEEDGEEEWDDYPYEAEEEFFEELRAASPSPLHDQDIEDRIDIHGPEHGDPAVEEEDRQENANGLPCDH